MTLGATLGVSGAGFCLSLFERCGDEAGVGVDLGHLGQDRVLQFVLRQALLVAAGRSPSRPCRASVVGVTLPATTVGARADHWMAAAVTHDR
ncbi:MAG: hypothetical protein ABSA21_04005 [Candidatus Limnocylindrales bacterium]